ncbi:hypothetical protein SAMN04488085_102213 [Geodermatophilus ruber]|uniref:Uncharacterized protein n=1 Tax=Geodermatophilus ruber TaxID=504800 RepID=A0A1I4AFJ7_9ACTN|nr:hypothetical protein SAMN04488085_102213 [Geodermatophilus ruber]
MVTCGSWWGKQLLSHLGQGGAWTAVGATSTAEIAGGTGRVVVGEGVFTLMAETPHPETLSQVQFVLGSHVERFGQRNSSPSPGSAMPTPTVHRLRQGRLVIGVPATTGLGSGDRV